MSEIKPLARPSRMPVLQKVHGLALTMAASEIMLASAEVMSEGIVEHPGSHKKPSFSGSTLIAIDLSGEGLAFSLDKESIDALRIAAANSILLRTRLLRIARVEAERRAAPYLVGEMRTEAEFIVEDHNLLVNIDIECTLVGEPVLEAGLEKGGT